jgi:hypothetical protein
MVDSADLVVAGDVKRSAVFHARDDPRRKNLIHDGSVVDASDEHVHVSVVARSSLENRGPGLSSRPACATTRRTSMFAMIPGKGRTGRTAISRSHLHVIHAATKGVSTVSSNSAIGQGVWESGGGGGAFRKLGKLANIAGAGGGWASPLKNIAVMIDTGRNNTFAHVVSHVSGVSGNMRAV